MKQTNISEIFSSNATRLKNILIEGEVFDLNHRKTKTDSYIIEGAIFDGTSSIYFSYFDEREPEFKNNSIIQIKGNVTPNKYKQGELTITPSKTRGLKVVGTKQKKIYDDGYDQHRVELQTFSFIDRKSVV